jgi:hypothetical protein
MTTISSALWFIGGLVLFSGLLTAWLAERRRTPHPAVAWPLMAIGAAVLLVSVAYRAATAIHAGDTSEALGSLFDGIAITVVAYGGLFIYARHTNRQA